MPLITLIRHGEPEIRGVLLGQLDPPLSASGRTMARDSFRNYHPEVIWTSPLRRARETAGLIESRQVRELADLSEIGMGEWTGRAWREVEESWSELARRKTSDWFGVPAPGGEGWPEFVARVQRAWHLIREGPVPAAVVAHQGVNAALRYLIDGRDPMSFRQEYCEVISLEYDRND